jgi:hypothetical protein
VEDLDEMKDIKADIDKMSPPIQTMSISRRAISSVSVKWRTPRTQSRKPKGCSSQGRQRARLTEDRCKDFRIGILRLLNTYTYAPLFDAYFASLG